MALTHFGSLLGANPGGARAMSGSEPQRSSAARLRRAHSLQLPTRANSKMTAPDLGRGCRSFAPKVGHRIAWRGLTRRLLYTHQLCARSQAQDDLMVPHDPGATIEPLYTNARHARSEHPPLSLPYVPRDATHAASGYRLEALEVNLMLRHVTLAYAARRARLRASPSCSVKVRVVAQSSRRAPLPGSRAD